MKAKWTGDLLGRMHCYGVTMEQIGEKLGVGKPYISMILNGRRSPDGARERLNGAFNEILKERKKWE